MKTLLVLLISLTVFSCKDKNQTPINDENELEMEESHTKIHKEMDKINEEYRKFEKQFISLYSDSEKNPLNAILKADSLLLVNKVEKDKYKSKIKSNIDRSLHSFKAELFYKIGKYKESITELETDDYKSGDNAAAYAANYVKLKDYKKAKSFIDSIGKGYYIYDYALGNYYESVGNKNEALKVYNAIKKDKSKKHYAYYKLAINRLVALNKNNPKFLDEIYYPTNNPSFEIADSDDENRKKIFKLMEELPENQDWAGTSILESPQINDKNYYWVRVETKQNKEFNYYIYEGTFEIKFLDPTNNKLMTLEEWRMSK